MAGESEAALFGKNGVSECRKIATGLYLEALAVDSRRDLIWYSDVIAGGVHAVRPDGSPVYSLNADRMWTGGVMLNDDGAILSSGAYGIMWNRPEDGSSGWLIRDVDGVPLLGVNEMVEDGEGGIYFGSIDIEMIAKGQPTRPAALYRLSADRRTTVVAPEVGFTNGIMRSLDGTRLFYNDTFDATYVIDIQSDGSFAPRRKVHAKDDCDGMAQEADGTLLITGYKSGHLVRLNDRAEELDAIITPAEAVTQVRFGGSDLRDIYLNCVPLNAGDGLAVGESPAVPSSYLLRGRVEKPGRALAPARFKL